MKVTMRVNGAERTGDVEPRVLLVDFLRTNLLLTGTHIGCDTTSCGACTVLLDGDPVKSCTVLAVQAEGRDIKTVEGIAQGGALAPIRWAISGNICRCTGYMNIVKAIQHAARLNAEAGKKPVAEGAIAGGAE